MENKIETIGSIGVIYCRDYIGYMYIYIYIFLLGGIVGGLGWKVLGSGLWA